MKKYVVEFSNGVVFKEEIFETEEQAVKYFNYEWDHLTKTEKSKIDVFEVYEIEISEEDFEKYTNGELDGAVVAFLSRTIDNYKLK